MTIKVRQLGGTTGNVNTDNETHTVLFDAWDTTTRWPQVASLYNAVTAFAPPTFLGQFPVGVTWDEDDDGNGHWQFSVTYGSGEPPTSTLRIGFDTTGGNIRMRASRGTTRYAPTGRQAPDFKGAVEVSGGEPQGVDVVIPALKLVFTYKWPKGVITVADTKTIGGKTGTTNDGDFYGFAAGELLFLGATGEIDLTTPTTIQYQFAASANAQNLSVGDIANITKAGHQHLWVAFEDTEDTTANKLVPRPLGAYVETLYGESDFSSFGIGS